MFTVFADLPTELKVQIVKRCQSIPYVRLRRTCRFVNLFCEEHKKALGIYIYRQTPEIFLLNSMKNTYPFYKRMRESDDDVSEPYLVVEYGTLYGEANLKIPLNVDTTERILAAISGFNFPEVSILNYGLEGDDLFATAFDLFMEIVGSLRVDTINFKNVTMEQFDKLTTKWSNLKQIRLRKSKNNVDLINTDLAKKLRMFSCCFADNYAPDNINFTSLLNSKSIVTLDWCSSSFSWTDLENIMMNYKSTMPEMYFYRLYLEETTQFFDLDLTTTLKGDIIPLDGFYAGCFRPKGTNFLEPEENHSQRNKFDYWFVELEEGGKWRQIAVTRKSWSFCTDVCVVLDKMTDEEDLNMAFVDLVDEIMLPGPVLDFSVIYARLGQLQTVEEKRSEAVGFVESIVAFYER